MPLQLRAQRAGDHVRELGRVGIVGEVAGHQRLEPRPHPASRLHDPGLEIALRKTGSLIEPAVEEDGVWGPEGGVKYFVNSTTYIGFSVQYVIGFDSDSDEFFNYQLALGFRK